MESEIMISAFLTKWGISEEAKSSILNHLNSFIRNGRSEKFRNPSTKDIPMEQLLNMYDKIADFEQPWMRQFDENERDKFQPRSNIPPFNTYKGELEEAWYLTPTWQVDEDVREKAFQSVVRRITGGKVEFLRAVSIDTAIDSLERDTNSGAFMFTRRSEVIDDHRDELSEKVRGLISGKEYRGKYVMTLRAKEGRISDNSDTKARVVMASSIDETTLALMTQIPLLTQLKRVSFFPSTVGPERDDEIVSNILSKGRVMSGDLAHFDMSVHYNKIAEYERFLKIIFQKKAHPLIVAMIECFTNGTLITPDAILKATTHHVMSGHGHTNALDSFVNAVDITYNWMKMYGTEPEFAVNGDDFILLIPEDFSVDEFSDLSASHGMTLEPSKQLISSEFCSFNARFMRSGDRVSVRNLYRTARSLEFPESIPELGEGGQSLRLVSILHVSESNTAFDELTNFHISHDRLGLGTKGPDSWKAVFSKDTVEKVGSALGHDKRGVPTASTLRGIHLWKVYKYLLLKRKKR